MWPVDPPVYTVSEVLTACTTRMRDRKLAQRVTEKLEELEAACAKLATALRSGSTYLLSASDFTSSELTVDELEWMYDNRMAKGPRPGRPPTAGRLIYDEIMAAPLFRRCPLCAVRPVGEMDHFLPKRKFSMLALCPSNLIGVCGDCNFIKGERTAVSQDDEFLHAYAPSWDGELWLRGSVSVVEPPLVEFEVSPPSSWTATHQNRADAHFRRFRLAELYMISSIALQGSIARFLANLHAEGGGQAVREHLKEMAESYRDVRRNSWEAAMYTALADDADYCEGIYGFAPV